METEQTEADAKIMEKIEQAVTPEEKQKLFEAIDYQVNIFNCFLIGYNSVGYDFKFFGRIQKV